MCKAVILDLADMQRERFRRRYGSRTVDRWTDSEVLQNYFTDLRVRRGIQSDEKEEDRDIICVASRAQQCVVTRHGAIVQLDARGVDVEEAHGVSSLYLPEVMASALRRMFRTANVDLEHETVDIRSRTTVDESKKIVSEKIIARIGVQSSSANETAVQPEEIGNLEVVESAAGDIESVGAKPSSDVLAMHDLIPNMDLAQFLSRPVLIHTFDWSTSTAYGAQSTFQPWYLFMNHSQIQYKLNNYAFIRGKLKLKFMIAASSMYYGKVSYFYRPLANLNSDTIDTPNTTGMDLMAYTQRPHIDIFPSDSQGAELELPFFYQKNWLQLSNSSEIQNFGIITPYVFNILQGANGQTGTATIRCFASMVDVQVSAPTYNLAAQASEEDEGEIQADEFETNPVSAPATAVAEAAGILARIPFIKPFALATQFGASTVARVGRALGYSVTSSIREVVSFQPVCAPPIASFDHSYPYSRLSGDPKQGLSVDPSMHGLPPIDELSISHLVQKEAFVTTVNWAMSSADDTELLNLAIVPWYFNQGTATGTTQYSMTPGAWISNLFWNWRGDMIFRFEIPCTFLHKGKLKFTYDPQANITGTDDTYTSSITEIVDIGTTTNFEIRVPYTQAYPMLRVLPVTSAVVPFQTSGFSSLHVEGISNGQMTMKVFNRLLGPTTSGTVPINVFVRCAENMEFASPGNSSANTGVLTRFPVQSSEEDEKRVRYGVQSYQQKQGIVQLMMGTPSPTPHPERFKLVQGEVITTLRQLCSRLSLSYIDMTPTTDTTHSNIELRLIRGRFPPLYGYDTAGMHTAASLTGGSNGAFNFCGFHVIPYVLPAFVGVRGSMNWHVMLSNNARISYASALRAPGYGLNMLASNTTAGGPYADAGTAARAVLGALLNQYPGATLTSQVNQAALSFNVPHYSAFRFDATDPTDYNSGTPVGATTDGRNSMFALNMELNPVSESTTLPSLKVWLHAGAGHDFLPLWFLNVPFMYQYNSVPAAI